MKECWRDDVVTAQVRERLKLFEEGTKSLEGWAEWARCGHGGPVFALARIYDLGKAADWGDHDARGLEDILTPEQIAQLKRSEPLTEVGRDRAEAVIYDERVAVAIDEFLHRPQTPAIWRAVAFSFLWKVPECQMPHVAGTYMTRLNPAARPVAVADETYVTALESLLEFVDLMVEDMRKRTVDLTPFQLEILQHKANGRTTPEIQELFPRLGKNSIEGQVGLILRKLEALNIGHAIAIAMRTGLVK